MAAPPDGRAGDLERHPGEDEGQQPKRNRNRYVEALIGRAGKITPRLIEVESPFRRFFHPLFGALKRIEDEYPTRMIAIIIPELVGSGWYDYFLHNQRTTALKAALLLRGGERVAVINVPWHLKRRGGNRRVLPREAGPAAAP